MLFPLKRKALISPTWGLKMVMPEELKMTDASQQLTSTYQCY